ncbi:hypothetical protein BSFA1_02410 [Burkholderia sp. SFA1]|nr:hypothetical protein BSFA1_02410 [Burkholderia sp. SFA1]
MRIVCGLPPRDGVWLGNTVRVADERDMEWIGGVGRAGAFLLEDRPARAMKANVTTRARRAGSRTGARGRA